MRHLVAAALVAIPIALAASIVWQGRGPPRAPRATGAAAAPKAAATEVSLSGLFAALPPGARVKAPVAYYDEKGLYEYINGAAPLYLARHFRRLAAAEVAVAGGGEVTADVYDMGAPENAASIFAAEVAPQARPVPGFDAAVAGPMSLVFRRGRFYVKLTAFDPGGEAALPDLGRALAAGMP